jgi:hypothetical protein
MLWINFGSDERRIRAYIKLGGKPVVRSRSSSRANTVSSTLMSKKKNPFKEDGNDADFEDEIGMLFEWANHLSLDHLEDYVVA